MGKIVAIGGGEISQNETEIIDKYIVKLSNKKEPKLLFIPTASNDAIGYIELVKAKFGELGCYVDSLCLITMTYTDKQIRDKVLSSDIIYVGGGDTVSMMKTWKENQLDVYLKEAYQKGIILSGLSAGSICWFMFGHSDGDSVNNDGYWDYERADGLGLINAAHCPHYNHVRREFFDEMMKNEIIHGIALEDNTAFVELDGEWFVLKSDRNRKAYILKPNKTEMIKEELEEGKIFKLAF